MGQALRQPDNVIPFRHDDDDDPHIVKLDGSHHHQRHHHAPTPTERRVARWLAKHVSFDGALPFVNRAGARLIVEVLKEDLLEWDGHWIVPERFTRPAGFLREQVRYRLQERV